MNSETRIGEGPVLLDATLRPNPPASPRILLGLLILVAGINLAFGLSFMLRGAWPVTPFMGADVALLAWALRASIRASRSLEHLTLTPDRLRIERRPARGAPDEIALNPYWLRVEIDEDALVPSPLVLRGDGKSLKIGNFLGRDERISFARVLKSALAAARQWRPK
jgi:uncharacterized membrane protein